MDGFIKKESYTLDFVTGVRLPELAQDLEAYHNIDAEAELTTMLTENITNEINQEILNNFFDLSERAPQDPIQPRQV